MYMTEVLLNWFSTLLEQLYTISQTRDNQKSLSLYALLQIQQAEKESKTDEGHIQAGGAGRLRQGSPNQNGKFSVQNQEKSDQASQKQTRTDEQTKQDWQSGA